MLLRFYMRRVLLIGRTHPTASTSAWNPEPTYGFSSSLFASAVRWKTTAGGKGNTIEKKKEKNKKVLSRWIEPCDAGVVLRVVGLSCEEYVVRPSGAVTP